MKSRFLGLYVLIALLSFSFAALALSQNTLSAPQAASRTTSSGCCNKGDKDSCKMKRENGDQTKGSCCKKQGGDQSSPGCSGCGGCGDSCQMKKGEGSSPSADGKSCCGSCDCSKDKTKTGVQK